MTTTVLAFAAMTVIFALGAMWGYWLSRDAESRDIYEEQHRTDKAYRTVPSAYDKFHDVFGKPE